MLRVGLTGGPGSGKTTVAGMFAALGVHVLQADEVGRALMQPGQAVFDEIVRRFGPAVLTAEGRLNRRVLAAIAFEQHRVDELNRIVHPAGIAAQQKWMRELTAQDPAAIAMIESALVFEGGRAGTVPEPRRRFDRIVLVTAPEEVKIARYVARMEQSAGPLDEAARTAAAADARARLAEQIPDAEKATLCDFVLDSCGEPGRLRPQVEAIYRDLRRSADAMETAKPAKTDPVE